MTSNTINPHSAENRPLTGFDKVCLVGKLVLWAIASIGTLFCAAYPKQRVVEIWTQLTAPDHMNEDTGYGSVMPPPPIHSHEQDLLAVWDYPAFLERQGKRAEIDAVMPHLTNVSTRRSTGTTSAVKGDAVSIYMDYLQVKSPERFVGLSELTKTGPVPATYVQDVVLPTVEKALEQGKEYVFIPIETTSGSTVLFTINLKNPSLEFYNPNTGYHGGEKIRAMDVTIEGFRAQLSDALFNGLRERLAEKHNPELVELREYLSQEVTNENHAEFKEGLVTLLRKSGSQLKSSPIYSDLWKLDRQKKPEYYEKAEKLYEILDKSPDEAREALSKGRWNYDYDLEFGVREILDDIIHPSLATKKRGPDLQNRFKQHIRKVIDEQTSLKGNLCARVDYLIRVDGTKRNPFVGVRHVFNNQKPKKTINSADTKVYVSNYMEERLDSPSSERGFETASSKLHDMTPRQGRIHMAEGLSKWYGAKNLAAS